MQVQMQEEEEEEEEVEEEEEKQQQQSQPPPAPAIPPPAIPPPWERLRVIAFVPCDHICVCQHKTDRKNLAGKENKTDGKDLCHICRAEVTGHLRVYLP